MMGGYQVAGLRQVYNGRVVLEIPELSIREGELLAVVGPSGAGKSTLLRLLHYLEPPTAGTIAYSQSSVKIEHTGFPAPLTLRRRIGMVFQRPEMALGTVYDNAALGVRFRGRVDPAAIDRVLDRVGIRHLRNAPVSELSGGELQRTAIARVLACAPEIALFDEPTANLDPANVALVEEILRGMRSAGTTIVLVTHNVFQARRLADRVAFLLAGNLVEVSKTEKFFTAPADPRTRAFAAGEMVY